MWIFRLFNIQSQTTQKEVEDNQKYAVEYERIDEINFNSIFSNKLANYVINDSNVNITGENARVELLDKTIQSMWKKAKKITSMGFGYGGVILVPYVKSGKIYYNIVSQSRVTIDETEGENIIGATIIADKRTVNRGIGNSKTYYRLTNYRVRNGNIEITQKFTDENGHEVPVPDFWKNIELKKVITGVDRALFGYIKSPINNRKTDDKYGVPITYGCDRLPLNGLFKKVDAGDDNFFEVFDPAFRPFTERLQELFKRLEHEIGTSAGILSEVNTANATATEIKRSMYDTFTIVDDMRSNIEKGIEDFLYSANVLANAYNLTPQGDYEVSFDWDYSLLEDSQETFTRNRRNKGK